jgi:hypothetical protein
MQDEDHLNQESDEVEVLDDPAIPPPAQQVWLWQTLTLATLFLCGVVSTLLWQVWRDRFPVLAPGYYLGTISGLSVAPIHWIVRKESSGNGDVIIVRKGWDPQPFTQPEKEVSALVISGPEGMLRFVGGEDQEGVSSGKVYRLNSDLTATWKLKRVFDENSQIAAVEIKEVWQWLNLRNEFASIELQIQNLESLIGQQRRETERLEGFVIRGDNLRARAEEKFKRTQNQLRQLHAELKRREGEALALEERLRLSQQVTQRGKLVSLSRESLEREWRWVDAVIRTASNDLPEDLKPAYERAQKVVALRRAIDEEREKIALLTPIPEELP